MWSDIKHENHLTIWTPLDARYSYWLNNCIKVQIKAMKSIHRFLFVIMGLFDLIIPPLLSLQVKTGHTDPCSFHDFIILTFRLTDKYLFAIFAYYNIYLPRVSDSSIYVPFILYGSVSLALPVYIL